MEHDWILVVAAGVVCLLVGAIVLFNRRRSGKGRLLALALNNMTQGVAMFDAAGRLRRLQQSISGNLRSVARYRKTRRQAHRHHSSSS